MKDYSKEIIENIDTYFLVVDKGGKILSHSKGAPSFLGLGNILGEYIEDVADMIPGNIWEEKVENVEILWKGNQGEHYEHLIFQSIPFEKGYILCFREAKPPRILITDAPFIYQLHSSIGITDKMKMAVVSAAEDKNPVLITGETGVGKEVLARIIHNQTGRKVNFILVKKVHQQWLLGM